MEAAATLVLEAEALGVDVIDLWREMRRSTDELLPSKPVGQLVARMRQERDAGEQPYSLPRVVTAAEYKLRPALRTVVHPGRGEKSGARSRDLLERGLLTLVALASKGSA